MPGVEGGRDDRAAVAALLGLEPKRVWALGPERKAGSGGDGDGTEHASNVLVDATHGIDNLHVIRDLVVAAFYEVPGGGGIGGVCRGGVWGWCVGGVWGLGTPTHHP